jgi:hypothetical protein
MEPKNQISSLERSVLSPPPECRAHLNRISPGPHRIAGYIFPMARPGPPFRYPFEDDAHPNNLAATVTNVLAGRVRPLPPGVSPGCAEMIAGLLQPRPERRSTLLVGAAKGSAD